VKVRPRTWRGADAAVADAPGERDDVPQGKDTGELYYRYTWGGSHDSAVMEWPATDIVHFRTYNPDNQSRGMSRLEPLRQTILNEDSARRAAAAMWSNGGRPSFVVSHPKAMSQPVQDRLSAQLAGLHKGVDNWGKIAILEEGMTPTLLPLNAEAMQYIEARKINREEACGMYDVPPPWSTSLTGRRSPTSPSRCARCTATRWRPAWGCSSPRWTPSCARLRPVRHHLRRVPAR
jgi:phage portal protein BeeE